MAKDTELEAINVAERIVEMLMRDYPKGNREAQMHTVTVAITACGYAMAVLAKTFLKSSAT